MGILRKILIIALIVLVGGIVLQSIGYIDTPLFAWFTEVQLK